MQGALSHINVIHQGSNSALAQQQQPHSFRASVHAPSARIHGAVIWLGANLDLQQHVTDQYFIRLGSSLHFSVLRHAPRFSSPPRQCWLTLLPETKTSTLICLHWGDLTGASPKLAQFCPITEEQLSRQPHLRGLAVWRRRWYGTEETWAQTGLKSILFHILSVSRRVSYWLFITLKCLSLEFWWVLGNVSPRINKNHLPVVISPSEQWTDVGWKERQGAALWFSLFNYCPTFTPSSENKTKGLLTYIWKQKNCLWKRKMPPVFAFWLPWLLLVAPAVTGCTNAVDRGERAAAFRLIKNNSWLANEEETVCQEVPWTSRETPFQSLGLKKKVNADASSRKRLRD